MNGNTFARAGVALLGAGLAVNGVIMMHVAEPWYEVVAKGTGPFNAHFVRDIGAAYLASGIAIVWGMWSRAHRGPLAAIAGVFLGLHALTHLLEAASGVTSLVMYCGLTAETGHSSQPTDAALNLSPTPTSELATRTLAVGAAMTSTAGGGAATTAGASLCVAR